MKNLIQLTLLLFLIFTDRAYSQNVPVSADANYLNDVRNFEKCIMRYYHPDKHKIKGLCENSCIFIRFKILKNGTIGDLAFSRNTVGFTPNIKETPIAITGALTEAFKKAESHSNSFRSLQSDDKTYLLPFVYYYGAGCYGEMSTAANPSVTTPINLPIDDRQGNAILNTLNFADKNVAQNRYTILRPIKVGKKDNRLFFD